MAFFYWRGGAGNFGSASSYDASSPDTNDKSGFGVANRSPGPGDFVAVGVSANIFGGGSAGAVDVESSATVSGTTNTTSYFIIGDGGYTGSVTVAGTWHDTGYLAVGNYSDGSLTILPGASAPYRQRVLSRTRGWHGR